MSSARSHISLGPFAIGQKIGEGGMGTVWKAVHRDNGRVVAVKVLRPELADDAEYRQGFHQEVRAIARMNHAAIVDIYDYGVVEQRVGRMHAELETGALWLAMEYAPQGSLENCPPPATWGEFRALLLEILDALAYAHARSLVHRDLKPENVLRRSERRGEKAEGWMLSDFGIAHINDAAPNRDTGDMSTASAGTPLFMAPEQLQGQWRDFGPWTDLYALGCLSFYLAAGRPPFDGKSAMAVALAHMSDEPPPLRPRLAVPAGFENWVRRLLVKDMAGRYRRAADAAEDLDRLGEPTPDEAPQAQAGDTSGSAVDTGPTKPMATLEEMPSLETRQIDSEQLAQKVSTDRAHSRADEIESLSTRVHLPDKTWRRRDRDRGTSLMPGAGKGIFGLRQPPYVGRVEARDKLWAQFRRVCSEKTARLVVIRGELGLDKSRLLRWMTRRAHETGHANTLVATYSPMMPPGGGLPQAFCAHLGATGLNRRRLYEHLESVYRTHLGEENPDPHHLAAVVEWMMPGGDDEADEGFPRVQLDSPRERHVVIEELLRHLCRRRPVIIGLEEGQWAGEDLGFANHLLSLRDEHRLPVFLMVTVRPGAMPERLVEHEYLELIEGSDGASSVEMEPLSHEEQERFIEHLIGLRESVIEAITARSGGTPLFAVQLVEDWMIRDALRSTPAGYALDDDEEIPETLDALLERRLEDVARAWRDPASGQMAMEVAAAIGVDVDAQVWEAGCKELKLDVDADYVDHLMAHGVTRPGPGGWQFRLPRYCDCLEAIARRTGRWHRIHSVIADVLAEEQDGTCAKFDELRARHLLEAQRFQDAIPLLWRAYKVVMEQSAYVSARSLLAQLERAFDGLGYGVDDPCRARLEIHRAETERFRGDQESAKRRIDAVWKRREELGPELLAEVHRVRGMVENFAGNFAAGLEEYRQAYDIFSQLGDEHGTVRSLSGMAWMYLAAGRYDDAHRAFDESARRAEALGARLQRGWSLLGMGQALFEEDGDRGEERAREALELFDEIGCRSGMALAHRTCGDYAREKGEFRPARDHYRRARDLARMTGHALADFAHALLGFCALAEGELNEAQRRLEEFAKATEDGKLPAFRPAADAGLLVVAARRGNRQAFDKRLETMGERLRPKSFVRRELVRLLGEARQICGEWGDGGRVETIDALIHRFEEAR